MSEFTKGPWKVKKENPIMVVMPEQAELGLGRKYAVCGGGNGEANAKLVAAAPDMYEALEASKYLVEWLSDNMCECDSDTGMAPCEACFHAEAIEKVLAKAKGE